MVGHEAVRCHPNACPIVTFLKDPLESSIVSCFFEQGKPANPPIQDMKGKASGGDSKPAWHEIFAE